MMHFNDTIIAIATAQGLGAIGMIRLSGKEAVTIANKIFRGKDLSKQVSHTLHFGKVVATPTASQLPSNLRRNTNENELEIIDEVVVSLFLAPKSYTGEDIVEISGHGSPYVLNKILEVALHAGARLAKPGEFTQRAFMNGKMDLAQAEAVADLIAADSKAAQQTALSQLRGGFSSELNTLRDELINFAALIELELDFAEEDVEFADRTKFLNLVDNLNSHVIKLIESFQLGNVIKKGVSVAIIGKPNAGKSTLLNALLNEERAIVSDIAGTTRDTIEETLNINGVVFRLIDTAGIRQHSSDIIENKGIERSKENAAKADIILYIKDLLSSDVDDYSFDWLQEYNKKTITVYNKFLEFHRRMEEQGITITPLFPSIDAKEGYQIDTIKNLIYEHAIGENINTENTIVTNARHYEALKKTHDSLNTIQNGLVQNISGDLLAIDIRRALHYLGEITGKVEVDRDILGTIFGKFCIGK